MERLTERDSKGKAWANLSIESSLEKTREHGRLTLNRLAAYEDTGLTPEQIQAQQQEIDRLTNLSELGAAIVEHQSQILEALTADKDEQAGRIMELDNGLKKLRTSFQWLSETINDLDYKSWAEYKIDDIDALLGGGEDGSSKDE